MGSATAHRAAGINVNADSSPFIGLISPLNDSFFLYFWRNPFLDAAFRGSLLFLAYVNALKASPNYFTMHTSLNSAAGLNENSFSYRDFGLRLGLL